MNLASAAQKWRWRDPAWGLASLRDNDLSTSATDAPLYRPLYSVRPHPTSAPALPAAGPRPWPPHRPRQSRPARAAPDSAARPACFAARPPDRYRLAGQAVAQAAKTHRPPRSRPADRNAVVAGKSGSERVNLGGR